MTESQRRVDAAVERVRVALASGRDWAFYAPRITRDDLTIILTALSESERARGVLEGAGLKAYRACISAWSCGEPLHRVKSMLDAVDGLGIALGEIPARTALTASRAINEQKED